MSLLSSAVDQQCLDSGAIQIINYYLIIITAVANIHDTEGTRTVDVDDKVSDNSLHLH